MNIGSGHQACGPSDPVGSSHPHTDKRENPASCRRMDGISMPAVFESVLDGILVFRVSGSLHASEFEAAMKAGEEQTEESGHIRYLVIYDGFEA